MAWLKSKTKNPPKTALILSGGGARAAYQVGVLQGLADILPKETANPFPILCGTSAGAINATALAIYARQFRQAVWRLVHVWGNFHVEQVFRADLWGLSASALHWFTNLVLGGLGRNRPLSLLDRAPLQQLLDHYLPFEQIQRNIDQGLLHALAITASSYSSGHTVSFFQGVDGLEPWRRSHRLGRAANIDLQHLMASSAIPFVFAPERIGDEFYGDGSMRQTAPISPALHLGARKIVVIGVKHADNGKSTDYPERQPTLGQIAGHVLDSIFLDNIEVDVERMERINRTLAQIPEKHHPEDSVTMRRVDILSIAPSRDLFRIAQRHAHYLPASLRLFLRGIGVSQHRGANLLSYLLFEKSFCRELIALGYGDTLERRAEIEAFFELNG